MMIWKIKPSVQLSLGSAKCAEERTKNLRQRRRTFLRLKSESNLRVPEKGIEPIFLTEHGPKPCASTSSATPATKPFYLA